MAQGKHFITKSAPSASDSSPAFAFEPAAPAPKAEKPKKVYKNKKRGEKKLSLTVKLLIGLLIVTLLLCLTVLILWLRGRHAMTETHVAPHFPEVTSEEAAETDVPVAAVTDDDDGTVISYKGKYYRYNEDVTNILLIGVDSDSTEVGKESQQSDLIVLAALDRAKNKITLLNIPRDAMCDMEILSDDGTYEGTAYAQIALSYAYGRNPEECAELCKNAVSAVFCGLPIHGYGAFYMDGIPALNDALGGVTVTILDDYPFKDMPAGKEMKLNGEQARRYMKSRLTDRVDASLLRLSRQKQYLLALINQAKATLRAEPSKIVPLYRSLESYISTDLSVGSISYLGSLAVMMDFSGDVTTLEGEMILSEDGRHAEYILDEGALYDTMLSVFYTEIER